MGKSITNRPKTVEQTSEEEHVPVAASQTGVNQPKSNLNPKKLLVRAAIGLVVFGTIFAALVFTNSIVLSEFKSTSYVNSKGTHYTFDFYTKHGSGKLKSGNTQLTSKVSKDGKFPLTLSITTTPDRGGYDQVKACSSFTKVFEVQNNNLKQKIWVCDMLAGKTTLPYTKDTVYVAGFRHDNKTHILTISQDYEDVGTNTTVAQDTIAQFGMGPYRADIEKIVSSIKVE